ncbi:MAG: CoB--CoM heterodisulfide reductase subunit B [Candidatus Methanolliviera sp. GoM_asphalt]|nr:MAG: CoB--CoM heterodisulfide reductase subunit B [Candidatus Methanolliviera sp. GoM_asphalt]
MKEYAYFLGCITPNRYPGIEAATMKVLKKFDIETRDLDGASCCPAPGVFGSFDLNTWLLIAARNVTLADMMGLDVYVTCNGCYGSLQEADHLLKEKPELKDWVNENLKDEDLEYKGNIEVKHVVELLYDDIGIKRLKEAVVAPLDAKIGVHYGCHFLKPSAVRGHGSSERPTILDELVEATGAESVDYKDKLMCCGAGGGVRTRDLEVSLTFTKQKFESMKKVGIDATINPCAFCHLQMDRGQVEIHDKFNGELFNMPVLFITQLIGLSLGMSTEELGLNAHAIPMTEKFIR